MISADDIDAMRKPRLLIIGYARHGKDTIAEMLHKKHGFKFISSSEFVGREIIWENWGKIRYPTFEAMFEDRVNWRKQWMEMISIYNTPDKSRTARTMLERGYDLYVGMRRLDELEASRDLFDYVVWVDRSKHLPPETGSMDITERNAQWDYKIENNGTLEDLERNVDSFARSIL